MVMKDISHDINNFLSAQGIQWEKTAIYTSVLVLYFPYIYIYIFQIMTVYTTIQAELSTKRDASLMLKDRISIKPSTTDVNHII